MVSFVENGLSLLSYQLCSYPVTQRVQRLQEVQTSHTAFVHCGGWIPWKKCPKTMYRTQYLAVEVPESRNVTSCCEGFEQLGFYCVLCESRGMEQAGGGGGGGEASCFSLEGRVAGTVCAGLRGFPEILDLSRKLLFSLDCTSGASRIQTYPPTLTLRFLIP